MYALPNIETHFFIDQPEPVIFSNGLSNANSRFDFKFNIVGLTDAMLYMSTIFVEQAQFLIYSSSSSTVSGSGLFALIEFLPLDI